MDADIGVKASTAAASHLKYLTDILISLKTCQEFGVKAAIGCMQIYRKKILESSFSTSYAILHITRYILKLLQNFTSSAPI